MRRDSWCQVVAVEAEAPNATTAVSRNYGRANKARIDLTGQLPGHTEPRQWPSRQRRPSLPAYEYLGRL